MREEFTYRSNKTDVDNIFVAADVLRRMLHELQELEVHNARLHFAMCTSGHAIRQQLDLLSGIAELLKADEAPVRARELDQRAKRLISRLASQLDQLSLEADNDDSNEAPSPRFSNAPGYE